MVVVPKLKKNLISANQFTSYNACTFEFDSSSFVIEIPDKKILASGHLYALEESYKEPLLQ